MERPSYAHRGSAVARSSWQEMLNKRQPASGVGVHRAVITCQNRLTTVIRGGHPSQADDGHFAAACLAPTAPEHITHAFATGIVCPVEDEQLHLL